MDRATIERAVTLATTSGELVHNVLIAQGWISERDYVAALARHLGLSVARADDLEPLTADPRRQSSLTVKSRDGGSRVAFVATAFRPLELASHADGSKPLLVTRAEAELAYLAVAGPLFPRRAVRALDGSDAQLSARLGAAAWQKLLLAIGLGMPLGAVLVAPELVLGWALAIVSIPFLCIVLLRGAALIEILRPRSKIPSEPVWLDDASLPTYSILVPLYDEAAVLPRLVRSLSALDYPSEKIEILLVLESSDRKTLAAARMMELPGNVRTIVVPPGGPRTKPKALNFALQLARGDLVVIYDAEDRPEPGQLRIAVAAFASGGPDLACVQACLNIYNPRAGFLTRQFALEYTVLFDAVLPAIDRLGLPMPLGGTSNHFPAALLRAVGGWDPYNVTEDADLGIRLARRGLRTATIQSTTWEEAPRAFGNWWRQRTRWLKGWMQTYLVHMRRPLRLLEDIGLVRWIGLQVIMGGILASALVHPVFWIVVAADLGQGRIPFTAAQGGWSWLLWICAINFVLGFAVSILVGVIATIRRGRARLAPWALLMPLYWLLISAAGYRAAWQLVRRPFLWEKTRHGA